MMTIEDLKVRPLELNRTHLGTLAIAENLPALRELLSHTDHEVASAAAAVLAVMGDTGSLKALLEAARRLCSSSILEALLECGPEARTSLADLSMESGRLGDLAWEALLEGLRRPAIRPAIFAQLTRLAAHKRSPSGLRKAAALRLFYHGWISSWKDLPTVKPILPILEEIRQAGCPLLFPGQRTALQSIAGPCFSALRRQITEQIRAAGQRGREMIRRYDDELARRSNNIQIAGPRLGRNEPCLCGSGKKYKKCCLERDQATHRLDPWVMAQEQLEWSPLGLDILPMGRPDAPRLLEILNETKPARLRVRPDDSAVAAWMVASRLNQMGDLVNGLEAIRATFQPRERAGLDVDAVLTQLVVNCQNPPDGYSSLLVDLLLEYGGENHLELAGEMLARNSARLLSTLDHLVACRASLSKLLALGDGALKHGAAWEVGEELAELVGAFYADDPWAEQALQELRERMAVEPLEDHVLADPHADFVLWQPHLDRLAQLPLPNLSSLAERLHQLGMWPGAGGEVSSDSLEPLQAELNCRRELQGLVAAELAGLIKSHQADVLEQADQARVPCALLDLQTVYWILPSGASLEEGCRCAAVAGTLAAELGLGDPRAFGWRGRLALRQSQQQAVLSDLLAGLNVAALEWQMPLPLVLFLALPELPEEGEPPELATADDPRVARAQRAGMHPLEHAALGASTGRFSPLAVAPTPVRATPLPPVCAVAPVETLAGLPVALDDDPAPARRALRKVLRRLCRLNKVGEAHTAVDLVSRGVRGHLRGQVRQAVEILLRRGILRDKPTLTGKHTSIEPKQLPKVLRFIAEGWLPEPSLASLLEEPPRAAR